MSGAVFDGADQGAGESPPGGERNTGDAGDGPDGQGVFGDLFEGLITHHRGDGQQLDVRVPVCKQQCDGVIMPGVAVEDDLPAFVAWFGFTFIFFMPLGPARAAGARTYQSDHDTSAGFTSKRLT